MSQPCPTSRWREGATLHAVPRVCTRREEKTLHPLLRPHPTRARTLPSEVNAFPTDAADMTNWQVWVKASTTFLTVYQVQSGGVLSWHQETDITSRIVFHKSWKGNMDATNSRDQQSRGKTEGISHVTTLGGKETSEFKKRRHWSQ